MGSTTDEQQRTTQFNRNIFKPTNYVKQQVKNICNKSGQVRK